MSIAPHGGKLVNREAPPEARADLVAKAAALPSVTLGERESSDLELLAVGALSPLEGFMGRADYERVVGEMRLASGLVWSIPVTLSASRAEAAALAEGRDVALRDRATGAVRGLLHLEEKYEYDKKREAREVYRTEETAHPAVGFLMGEAGDVLLGGKVTLLARAAVPPDEAPHRRDPAQTRAYFAEKGWRTVVAFQTRNPIHRAHEYLTKVALEICDGLMIHPIVGYTKGDDIPAPVRLRCYVALLERYYPAERTLLSLLPAAMRYGGPREAIFHATMRKNYGCTHFIVGRDHAGVGSYYGTYDAQRIFDGFAPDEIGITPLMFEHSFWCKRCGSMASSKTCPHAAADRVALSGTKVRELLRAGEMPPPEFSRPEVAQILIDSMKETA
ncbi:MAG TPA: sulfate adenylyltransferase [Myxococcota bacterium]|jgi:sulfate adenylyltransferase|nr:sulfate adenylyltransferase [Myxococcota bacterium]